MFLGPVYLRKLFGYSGTYYDWFRVELLVIGLLMLAATAYALAQLGTSRRRAYAALCLVGIGPVLLGPDALARFDYWPALLAVAAVAALVARRPMLACGFAEHRNRREGVPGGAHPARAHRAVAHARGSSGRERDCAQRRGARGDRASVSHRGA